jgi:phage FluMu protein Com
MLKIRCFKCGWAWSMNAAAMQAAMQTLEPGAKHYIAECPRCRRVNKISVKQMRSMLERAPAAESEEKEEQEEQEEAKE